MSLECLIKFDFRMISSKMFLFSDVVFSSQIGNDYRLTLIV